ncbi:MAG: carbohydrate ABC transporter permease, partial [Butyrivibrio sp.]|nr:carbohydrate ABC transporter permease [Butyrivibrio sp.]
MIAYIVLTLVSVLCLFWFYVLIINATRAHGEIQSGFSAIPSK